MVAYLPWDQIHSLLLYGGAAETRDELFDRMLKGVGEIIPWDVGIGVFDRDIRCVACDGWDRRTLEQYNAYYYAKVPFILYDNQGVACRGRDVVQWSRMPDSEFVQDFARPLGLHSGLSPFRPAWPLNISVQRSRESPPFTGRDCEILDIINGHFHNYLTQLARCEAASGRDALGRAAVDDTAGFPAARNDAETGAEPAEESRVAARNALCACFRLSDREMEVLEGLCDGLSNKALAANLFISERTVKAHLSSIFRKTGCVSRMETAALAHRAF